MVESGWITLSAYDRALVAQERLRWSVFPLDSTKQPPILPGKVKENGDPMRMGWKRYQSNAATKVQVMNWQREFAPPAWAIITGKVSGIIVLDFDCKEGDKGQETLERLGLQPHIKTGSGGYHVYFHHPGWPVSTLNSKSKKELGRRWPGLDIRADGGYAAFAGKNGQGAYEWLRDPEPEDLAILPDNLRDFLGLLYAPDDPQAKEQARQRIANHALEKYLSESHVRGRDNACFELACQLRDNGFDQAEAKQIAAEFAKRVHTTNMKGSHEPYTDEEARAKIDSAYSGAAREPWSISSQNGTAPVASTPEKKPALFNRTDLGNAERLVARFGGDLRYCHAMNNWLVWKGTHWQEDKDGHAERLAKQTVRHIYKEAAATDDDSERKAIAIHAIRSESKKYIRDMLILAQSEPSIPIRREDLDTDHWLLNCANGTIDLRTGALRLHSREYLITRCLATKYVKDATCPAWIAFLNRIFDGKQELITFIQRALGYALTGDTSEQCFFLLHGTGQNGKSTLLEVIQALLNEYSQSAEFRTFLSRDNEGIRNDIARMNGKRLVVAKESDKGKRLAEALIKQLTGEDTITARFLHQEYFDFKPQFKLFLAANHKPEIQGTDLGIWRRVRLIPFTVTIPEDQKDKDLSKKLLQESEGILAWLVQGCLDWQREGLGVPEIVKEATKKYRDEMDVISSFLDACCCVTEKNAEVGATRLYEAYKKWCEETGERWEKQKTFGERLTERGYQRERTHTGMVYRGLRLLTSDDAVNDVNDVNEDSAFSKKSPIHEEKTGNIIHNHSHHSQTPSEKAKKDAAKIGDLPTSTMVNTIAAAELEKAQQFYQQFCATPGYSLRIRPEDNKIGIAVPDTVSDAEYERMVDQVCAQDEKALRQVIEQEEQKSA